MNPRSIVTINDAMLRAIFTKPKKQNNAPFMTRLLQSLQLVVRMGKKGVTFIGIRGGAEF